MFPIILLHFLLLNSDSANATSATKTQRAPAQDAYVALKTEFENSSVFLDQIETAKKFSQEQKVWEKATDLFRKNIDEQIRKLPAELNESDRLGNYKAIYFEDLRSLSYEIQKPNCANVKNEQDIIRLYVNPNSDSASNVSSAAKTWIRFIEFFCNGKIN